MTAAGAVAAVMLVFGALLMDNDSGETRTTTPTAIPLAVLGDSDSHSYHDRLWFEADGPERGGPYRSTTFQWTEVLARLRGDRLDLGPWGRWGTRGSIARLQDGLGLPSRAPRKEDYFHNFAFSGAVCGDLMHGSSRQAPRLLRLMDHDAVRWRDGIVVIRIGINSFGRADGLDRLSRDPDAADVQSTIEQCVRDIRDAIGLLRGRYPQTRFVLVGIFDNAHWPKYFGRWQSARGLANISVGLDRFDTALRQLAQAGSGIAFFDDRAWFTERWGARGHDGRPAYRELKLGRSFIVGNSAGDHPRHSVLADGHAGAVWNALWAQSLVELVNTRFATRVRPIADDEIVRLLDPDAALGIR
jgi:hypothetical protein